MSIPIETPDPMEVFAMPAGAIELPEGTGLGSERSLAVAALRQVLATQPNAISFGPETSAEEEGRLLSLNRFAVQLVTSGLASDQVGVDIGPWQSADVAPQLLLAAEVDDENDVVAFTGVLTGPEFVSMARSAERHGELLLLDTSLFRGGIERLLTLVQLLEPEALPRLALAPIGVAVRKTVVVLDWLRGQLDDAFAALGGELIPVTAGVFRSGSVAEGVEQAMAALVIPFGLAGEQLVSGDAAQRCVRRFQLALIPTGVEQPTGLLLRLTSAVPGALLPDGLQLLAQQGSHQQQIGSEACTQLELSFQASSDLLDVSLRYGTGDAVELPTLQIPQ